MTRVQVLLVALAFAAVSGCEIGGPERASDIQNTNGISDDIANVRMTQSDRLHAHDPNLPTTYPNHYQVVKEAND